MRSLVFPMALGLSFISQMASAQMVEPRPNTAVVVPRERAMPVIVNEARPVPMMREPAFGRAHQLILGGATNFSINGSHAANHGAELDGFAVSLAPKIGYFVSDLLVLGGRVGASYEQEAGAKVLQVDAGPTIAVHVPLTHCLSLLPELSVTYAYGFTPGSALDVSEQSQNVVVRLELNGLIHLAPHVSAMISPLIEQTVMNKTQQPNVANSEKALGSLTRYGAQVGLLVWL